MSRPAEKWRKDFRGLQEGYGSKCGPPEEPSELCERPSYAWLGVQGVCGTFGKGHLAGASRCGFTGSYGAVWIGLGAIVSFLRFPGTQRLRLSCWFCFLRLRFSGMGFIGKAMIISEEE